MVGIAKVGADGVRLPAMPPSGRRAVLRTVRRLPSELRATFVREAEVVEVAEYEPKMNVTPNAVALKDD